LRIEPIGYFLANAKGRQDQFRGLWPAVAATQRMGFVHGDPKVAYPRLAAQSSDLAGGYGQCGDRFLRPLLQMCLVRREDVLQFDSHRWPPFALSCGATRW